MIDTEKKLLEQRERLNKLISPENKEELEELLVSVTRWRRDGRDR